MTTLHSKAACDFLKKHDNVTWHDATFWSLRDKRDAMAHGLEEWEQLRETASGIKRHTVTHLDKYLEQFADNAEKNGAHVHWAKDAAEFNSIVLSILKEHNVTKLVKSKSMLTEECGMNDYLERQGGIDVVETDLGERILQLMHKRPSHIVVPATHITQEEVGRLFEEKLGSEKGNYDPTYLTYQARLSLRNEFKAAGAGMTGANFAVAETGDIVVCTNEGNADMSTSVPKLHIVAMGMEKVVPDYRSLSVFQRLLCRAATGQPTTAFTSHFRRPRPGGELHIVIVDNGRTDIIADPEHWETLKCIRCGSCMNTCPVYRRSGGYSYTYFIPGPIGINLGMLKDAVRYSDNVSACTLCCSCDNVCPVKVNLSEQIYRWRQGLDALGKADKMKKVLSTGMKYLFAHPALYNTALKFAPLANHVPRAIMYNKLNAWGYAHEMPEFKKKPFHEIIKEESRG